MKKLALFTIGAVLLFSSCTNYVKIDFDNPTKTAQKVTFDGKEFTLWVFESVTRKVPKGEHTIQIGTDSVITYNFTEDEYLINPLRATYIIENVKYTSASFAQFQNMFDEANENAASNLGEDLAANFEVFDDLIKVRDWDFKQREEVPETMTVSSSSVSKTKRKLYAPDELEDLLDAQKR